MTITLEPRRHLSNSVQEKWFILTHFFAAKIAEQSMQDSSFSQVKYPVSNCLCVLTMGLRHFVVYYFLLQTYADWLEGRFDRPSH